MGKTKAILIEYLMQKLEVYFKTILNDKVIRNAARSAKFFVFDWQKLRFCGFLVLLNLRAQFLKEFTFEGSISYKRVSYKK